VKAGGRIAVAGATGRVGRHVVNVLEQQGYEVVAISRSAGVDVVTGDGLADALSGVESLVDATSGASPEQQAATDFFTAATRNLQERGASAGVRRIIVVSIIGTDRFTGGYGAAKQAHERAMLAGPIPSTIVRAAQFHEFVSQLTDWGRQDGAIYLPKMRTQLVAARTVAELLADLATGCGPAPPRGANGPAISRSPVRERRTSSRPHDCSQPIAANKCRSRASATRTTRTGRSTSRVRCYPARMRSSPALRSSNGSAVRSLASPDGEGVDRASLDRCAQRMRVNAEPRAYQSRAVKSCGPSASQDLAFCGAKIDPLLHREGTSHGGWQPAADALLTMEVWERHARTRAITRDAVSPANRPDQEAGDASRDVARVVSDVSVLCPRGVDDSDNLGGRLRHDDRTSSQPAGFVQPDDHFTQSAARSSP
jgi:NAD(P)H-binding